MKGIFNFHPPSGGPIFKTGLISLLLLLAYCVWPQSSLADNHGYGQGFCSQGSICYTGSTKGDLKPGKQCGNLSDWHYGYDSTIANAVPECFFGYCCDPNTPPPTPTPNPNLPLPGLPPGCNAGSNNGPCTQVDTAIGPIQTNPTGLVQALFKILLSLSGGVAFLLIIAAGYEMMTSQGNPEKVKGARERLTSAIVGLLFIIFSVAILQIIGVDILQIPGFSR